MKAANCGVNLPYSPKSLLISKEVIMRMSAYSLNLKTLLSTNSDLFLTHFNAFQELFIFLIVCTYVCLPVGMCT